MKSVRWAIMVISFFAVIVLILLPEDSEIRIFTIPSTYSISWGRDESTWRFPIYVSKASPWFEDSSYVVSAMLIDDSFEIPCEVTQFVSTDYELAYLSLKYQEILVEIHLDVLSENTWSLRGNDVSLRLRWEGDHEYTFRVGSLWIEKRVQDVGLSLVALSGISTSEIPLEGVLMSVANQTQQNIYIHDITPGVGHVSIAYSEIQSANDLVPQSRWLEDSSEFVEIESVIILPPMSTMTFYLPLMTTEDKTPPESFFLKLDFEWMNQAYHYTTDDFLFYHQLVMEVTSDDVVFAFDTH